MEYQTSASIPTEVDVHKPQIKVFPGLVTYVGRTREEALAKKQALDAKLPLETALEQLSIFVQQDCSKWAIDEKVPPLPRGFPGA